jgi:predicted SPOUT superfamily RNA methylase MTH1
MTQTEKAKQLYELIRYHVSTLKGTEALINQVAKRCALFAVDEIITALDEHQWQNRNVIEFYFSVKQEIEKL